MRGKTYYPLKSAHGFVEVGTASWYGPGFHGKKTANGERYNQYAMTAAHKILPLGTKVRVTHLGNGRSIIVRVNDRGPFVDDRVIDLSRSAATRLNMMGTGTARVRVQSLGGIPQLRENGDMSGPFYVQVGAFADKNNAYKLINILTRSGHKAAWSSAATTCGTCRWAPGRITRAADAGPCSELSTPTPLWWGGVEQSILMVRKLRESHETAPEPHRQHDD